MRPNKRGGGKNETNVDVLNSDYQIGFPIGLLHLLHCIFKIWGEKVVEHLNIIKAEGPHKH